MFTIWEIVSKVFLDIVKIIIEIFVGYPCKFGNLTSSKNHSQKYYF